MRVAQAEQEREERDRLGACVGAALTAAAAGWRLRLPGRRVAVTFEELAVTI